MLWHAWIDPADRRPEAATFIDKYKSVLDAPSASAFTVSLLSNQPMPAWSADDWVTMAQARNDARHTKSQAPLPAVIDALIQLFTADELEAAGRHNEAVAFAAHAVGESPGNDALLAWEARLVAGNHDPDFDVRTFLFGERKGEARETSEDERPGELSGEHHEATRNEP